MTEAEIEAVAEAAAERAAERAVREFCLRIGLPTETADDVRRAQADFAYIRNERETKQRMAGWIIKAVVVGIASGVMAATWAGIKSLMGEGR